jgi:hypothetical protein
LLEDRDSHFDRETWLLITNRRLDQVETLKSETASYVHRMSSWMIAQLFIANAGGLTIQPRLSTQQASAAFAAGLVLAMLCVLAAWAQALVTYHALSQASDARALVGPEHEVGVPPTLQVGERRLFYGTLALGLGSLAAFVVGISERIGA